MFHFGLVEGADGCAARHRALLAFKTYEMTLFSCGQTVKLCLPCRTVQQLLQTLRSQRLPSVLERPAGDCKSCSAGEAHL